MNSRPRMLMVSPSAVADPLFGTTLQIANRIRHLARHFDITLVSPTPDDALTERVLSNIAGHVAITRSRKSSLQTVGRLIAGGMTYHEARFSFFADAGPLRGGDFDVVYLNFLLSSEVWRTLEPEITYRSIVVDLHNDDADRFRQYLRRTRNPIRKAVLKRMVKNSERRLCDAARRYDLLLCVSDHDRLGVTGVVGAAGAAKVLTIENGVDTADFAAPTGKQRSRDLLFVGSLDVQMNQDAARSLLDEYWPAIAAADAAMTLKISGKGPPEWLRQASTDRIEVVSNPSDTKPLFWQSFALIAPYETGGGRKLKVLEAMASGCLVFTTAAAMQGIDATPGRHYVLVSSGEQAAGELTRLWSDPAAAGQIRGDALDFARTQDWAVTTEKLATSLLQPGRPERAIRAA